VLQLDPIKQLPQNMLMPKRMRKKSDKAQQRGRPHVWETRHVVVTESGFTYYRPRQSDNQAAPQGRFYAFSSLDFDFEGRPELGKHINVRENRDTSQWRQLHAQHCLAILSDRRLVHLDAVRTFEMLWIATQLRQQKTLLNTFYWPDLPPNSAGAMVTLVPEYSALNGCDPHYHRVQVEMPCNDDSKGVVVWMPYETGHDEVRTASCSCRNRQIRRFILADPSLHPTAPLTRILCACRSLSLVHVLVHRCRSLCRTPSPLASALVTLLS
jgi:hypothetical protein